MSGVNVPTTMEVSTCGIVTHPHTDYWLHECQKILLPDEFDWYPSNNLFRFLQWRRSIGQVQISNRYIDIVEIRFLCAPPTIQCRDYSGIHDFDRAMAYVAIGMAQDLMVDRLISKVRVKRIRSGFSTYTYK